MQKARAGPGTFRASLQLGTKCAHQAKLGGFRPLLKENELGQLLQVTQAIGRMLNGLILALRARYRESPPRASSARARTPNP